jgi:hypothetical protein
MFDRVLSDVFANRRSPFEVEIHNHNHDVLGPVAALILFAEGRSLLADSGSPNSLRPLYARAAMAAARALELDNKSLSKMW